MTKKDYLKITRAINSTLSVIDNRDELSAISKLKGALIAEFEATEPRFDRWKFMQELAPATDEAHKRINAKIDSDD